MKKALFVANFNSFHRQFNIPYIDRLKKAGYEVSLVSGGPNEFEGIGHKFDISFDRTPYHFSNIKSFFKLRKVYSSYYDLIYIATSVVGGFARLALLGKKHGRVVYSAHGYNFYNVNGTVVGKMYLPIEKVLSRFCDCIFTMNKEDYEVTINNHFPCKEIYNVDGVGIDTEKFTKPSEEEKRNLREQYGYNDKTFILFYAAELTARKNQIILLDIIKQLSQEYDNVKLLLAGAGEETEHYKQIARKKNLEGFVEFLGFRRDVKSLLKISDVLIASSLNEGLPINMIEGLSTGLPVIATSVRGHVDLIEEGKNGFLFNTSNTSKAVTDIERLMTDKELYSSMSNNAATSAQKYDIKVVVPQYDKIWGIDS